MLKDRGLLTFTKNTVFLRLKTKKGKFVNKYFGRWGTPDYFIFLKGGKTIHLNVMRRFRVLSNLQKAYKINVEALGHIYAEVRSIEDVGFIINRHSG